jgi:hypothetical protein
MPIDNQLVEQILADQMAAMDRINNRWNPAQWVVVDDINPAGEMPAIRVEPGQMFFEPRRNVRDLDELLEVRPSRIKGENGPALWNKVLYAVREIFEAQYCCVAGGAVRDYICGLPAKDMDVFVNLREGSYKSKDLVELGQELGWGEVQQVRHIEPYAKDKEFGKNGNQVIFKGRLDGYEIDFIVAPRDPEQIVKGFDFHINECWYDGERIQQTKEAVIDTAKKQWTPSRDLTEVTKAHFERVNKRVGGKYKLNLGEPWYMKFGDKVKIR